MKKELLKKYLQGNCSDKEFDQFLLWIREESLTNSGKAIVQELWAEFEPEAGPVEKLKYDRILNQIHRKIDTVPKFNRFTIQKAMGRRRILTVITRFAAVLLLPVLLLLVYSNLPLKGKFAENLSDLEVVAPLGARMHIELGDGTKVWLNNGSSLKYPYEFKGNDRRVYLNGEGYFEVAHNQKIPFIVETKFLDVKATGTIFNVNAYAGDDTVETTLVEGKVILYDTGNNEKVKALTPNECLKFNPVSRVYKLDRGNTEKYVAWKDGFLVFKNDPISEITKKLERRYNIKIETTDELINEYTCTATFAEEPLSQVLELLALATPITYEFVPREKMPDGSFSKQRIRIGRRNE
ncbi:FecR family protein [uncultured Sunxiuqinia sp.]|uniref:FecR family protein n=1 Tax=uncultured Sunxiuqinia sp. TaxID=1573825 RepID=UPI002AA7906B|nr:FecR family protein [uncultured Sunxiuqinia sp.]